MVLLHMSNSFSPSKMLHMWALFLYPKNHCSLYKECTLLSFRELDTFEYALQCTSLKITDTLLGCSQVFPHLGIGSHEYSHGHPRLKVFKNERIIHQSMRN